MDAAVATRSTAKQRRAGRRRARKRASGGTRWWTGGMTRWS